MEYRRDIEHIKRLTCLHLDNGSKSDNLIHRHAEFLRPGVILIVELVPHVVQEPSDDGLRARVDIEIIRIGIEISGEDKVSSVLDLDL